MNNIEKLENVTWYGHCVIHLMAAINAMSTHVVNILVGEVRCDALLFGSEAVDVSYPVPNEDVCY
jgi:hypothetical protein